MSTTKAEYPAGAVDLRSALEAFAEGERRAFSVCFPACIREYDRKTHIAKVVPLVKQGILEEEWVYKIREPYEVSVRAIQIGGFTVDIPLYVGDTGWVIASDRDTTLLKQDGALTKSVLEKDRSQKVVDATYPQKPHQTMLHDYSRGFFIPDNWGQWNSDRIRGGEALNIGDALYIGASVGTKDENRVASKDKDEDGTPNSGGDQEGEEYDKHIASGIALERDGGLHLLSSTPKDENKVSRMSILGNSIESQIDDEKSETVIESIISPSDGLLKRYEEKDKHFLIETNGARASIQNISSDTNIVNMYFNEGDVTIETTKGIEIEADENIQIANRNFMSIDVIAEEIELKAKGDLTLSSENIYIKAGKDVTIESSKDMYIASGTDLLFGAIGSITISSGENLHLKAGAEIRERIHIDGKVTMETEEPFSITEDFSYISIGKVSIAQGISIGCPSYTVYTPGDETTPPSRTDFIGDANISAKTITLTAAKDVMIGGPVVELEGYSKGTAKDYMDRTVYIWVP